MLESYHVVRKHREEEKSILLQWGRISISKRGVEQDYNTSKSVILYSSQSNPTSKRTSKLLMGKGRELLKKSQLDGHYCRNTLSYATFLQVLLSFLALEF